MVGGLPARKKLPVSIIVAIALLFEIVMAATHPRQSDAQHHHADLSVRGDQAVAEWAADHLSPFPTACSRHTGRLTRTHDRLFSPRNRFRTRPLHHRPADAKRAVAIALRNRWRRLQLDGKLREEVLPKNILMIGPTGVGKTEISRRLARLAGAPFLKVEATKFTEVGYVGRDVEQIIRDLVEVAIALTRERKRKDVQARAQQAAEERVLDALVGARLPAPRRGNPSARSCAPANSTTRRSRSRCSPSRRHADVRDSRHARRADGRDLDRRHLRQDGRPHQDPPRSRSKDSHELLIDEESDKLLDQRSAGAGSDPRGREQRHRLPRRDRQDLRARRPQRRRRVARRRAARPAAADRGHHGLDQARRR